MRIRHHEITPITLIHLAILAAITIVLLVFAARAYGRVRESWVRDRIVSSLAPAERPVYQSGVASPNALITADRERTAPRMILGVLQARLQHYTDAKEAFEGAALTKNATPEEKSLAYSAAAACVALNGAP